MERQAISWSLEYLKRKINIVEVTSGIKVNVNIQHTYSTGLSICLHLPRLHQSGVPYGGCSP